MHTVEGRTRVKQTLVARYGVEYVGQIPGLVEKRERSALRLYGVKSISQLADQKAKVRQTCITRYGGPGPSSSPAVRDKIRCTLLRRYGVEHALQFPGFLTKQIRSSYTYKTVTLPSGRTVALQGYEPQVLSKLFDNGMVEHDFEFDKTKWPVLTYQTDGATHRYTPDFFVPRLNWVLEVKSPWSFKLHVQRNLAKRAAVKQAGYAFNFVIRDYEHNPLKQHAAP
jgi:hypothetical protein